MDFGVSFLSNNVMLPLLDLFYGFFPSYGLAIVALTLIIRFALYPLSAGSIRSMRRTKISQPLMQKRMKEIQERYKDNPTKQQEEMSQIYKEFGNPLAGCLPVLVQMPVLFALFATLRGSPFSDINYSVNVQILPKEQIEQVQHQTFSTSAQNIYFADGVHDRITAVLPQGNNLVVGEKAQFQWQNETGKSLGEITKDYPESNLKPRWQVIKGQENIKIDQAGNIEAIQPGEVTLQGTIPGLAADKGFLFIDALGRVGAIDPDGTIHWDILSMIIFFGLSLYVNQVLSGSQPNDSKSDNPQQAAQSTVNKLTPVIFSGMFLFFPLPAGVLMYMSIANVFQTAQTFILMREPLPENLQKLVEEQEKAARKKEGKDVLPFEGTKGNKKKA
jgi:YidC/Oxa1 family membrane protein insertase